MVSISLRHLVRPPLRAELRYPLDAAIRQLDSQLSNLPGADVEVEQRIRLHLMKMIAGEPVSQQLNLEGRNAGPMIA